MRGSLRLCSERSETKEQIPPSRPELGGIIMMSEIPINLSKVSKENIDKEILRTGIIA